MELKIYCKIFRFSAVNFYTLEKHELFSVLIETVRDVRSATITPAASSCAQSSFFDDSDGVLQWTDLISFWTSFWLLKREKNQQLTCNLFKFSNIEKFLFITVFLKWITQWLEFQVSKKLSYFFLSMRSAFESAVSSVLSFFNTRIFLSWSEDCNNVGSFCNRFTNRILSNFSETLFRDCCFFVKIL